MPALETFDWFFREVQSRASEAVKKYLQEQRAYLLNIRNENERRRFLEEVMLEARSLMQEQNKN
ncbi:MAG: hypothetical protein HBSIN02_08460 [Bacteroidia bacterium]|nr:MAG: hypothetical protein HBSIN02_08460 [Bacteroidia bacterium]